MSGSAHAVGYYRGTLYEVGHKFRDCAYTPMVVVWMFITQVLAADHSCQQAVARLNAWRIAQG